MKLTKEQAKKHQEAFNAIQMRFDTISSVAEYGKIDKGSLNDVVKNFNLYLIDLENIFYTMVEDFETDNNDN